MTLAELIAALEAADPDRVVPHGFTHPHSYRGYYNELAFEPAANVTVADMLADARSALYATYEGWKGGDFTMSDSTDCWLSMEGCASGDTISALLLELMLTSVAPEDLLPAWEAVYEPGNVSDYLIGYANSEAAAKGAAEAWMRSQAEVIGRLEWVPWGDVTPMPDGYDRWFELVHRHDDGIDTGPGITVRRRTAPAETAAPAPPVAPLAACQHSEAPVEGETATRPPTGRVGDSGAEVVERDAIHLHFGLTYANYLVIPRTLLQSMDDEWQTGFVAFLDRLNEAFAHVPQAKGYKVEAATEHEVSDLDEQQLAELGITEDWYRGETPPEGLSPEDLAEWEATHEDPEGPAYSRDGEELDPHQRVLIPCEDPVPHYNRGRTRIQPQPGLPDTWISPATGATFDLHADYPVSRAQYDALLKGEDHGCQGLTWRHFRDFADGIPVLIAVRVVDEESIEGSIKLTDYEAAAAGGDR